MKVLNALLLHCFCGHVICSGYVAIAGTVCTHLTFASNAFCSPEVSERQKDIKIVNSHAVCLQRLLLAHSILALTPRSGDGQVEATTAVMADISCLSLGPQQLWTNHASDDLSACPG